MEFPAVIIVVSLAVMVRGDSHVTAVCHMEQNKQLSGSSSPKVTGKVTLVQQTIGGPTQITVDLKGLTTNSVHGFHIHNSGDIISRGCQSCGPHYRPDGTQHAAPRDQKRHIGDLGNVMSNSKGEIKTAFIDYLVSLHGNDSVIGRSIVIHALRDDLGGAR
ncbi:superoxide dismutase [Cu-Zn] [Exaiptasia diaphana]|uniref:Superoxide dismutase copper/zinc binding domain-containing protein n=1 Tax=Exaiptasia diaphana TaxID=2652724 RepID=A0A913XE31_EXADI|nr:superoxide dismutase [Cu-Zn] [Exaiptasia diaphana]KXJ12716.1 Superoxide dismutase [Cu-Zn] [Exaiptasia diaphana]